MQAEILMIGTELLLGQIEDTNATHMSRVLAENGVNLYQKTTVGDNRRRIVMCLDNALDRSDAVLCSGGLGPTEDDITRECVAEVLGRPLEYHEEIYDHIANLFARYKFKITENNKKQAMVPQGAQVIDNPFGTAPGLLIDDSRGVVVCMPGVPSELKPMLAEHIVPFLRDKFGLSGIIHYRVLKVCGMGESRVDQAIGDLMNKHDNPTIGVLANPAAVRIRIAARAKDLDEANALIDPVDAEVRERLPGRVMGTDDDTIETVVDALLAERGWTLSVAETDSGGIICQCLVTHKCGQFLGGRVYRIETLSGGTAMEKALDIARQNMIDYSATCGLGVVSDPEEGRTAVVFVDPDGVAEWEFGRVGRDEIMQLRTSVAALEYIRRRLVGVEAR